MCEPGVLALRISARRLLARGNRFFARQLAGNTGGDLAHADPAHHWQIRVEAARDQRPHFTDGALLHHLCEPLVATRVEPVARREQDQRPEIDLRADAALMVLLPVGEGAAGRDDHFERPRYSCTVTDIEPRSASGVEPLQFLPIFFHRRSADSLPDLRIDLRHRRDAVEQGAQIESRSADENRQPPFRMDVIDLAPRHRRPVRRRAGNRPVEEAVQAVLGAGALVRGRRCAEDGQIAIDLRAVGIDDHSARRFGKRQCKCRLAACRRPRD